MDPECRYYFQRGDYMRWKYRIGVIVVVCIVCTAYYASYQRTGTYGIGHKGEELEMAAQDVALSKDKKVVVQGKSDHKFYLREENNRITVYRTENQLVYEYTNIKMEALPEQLQQEIKDTKYMKDFNELYNFLENYSI